jgi:hypothetical protein
VIIRIMPPVEAARTVNSVRDLRFVDKLVGMDDTAVERAADAMAVLR